MNDNPSRHTIRIQANNRPSKIYDVFRHGKTMPRPETSSLERQQRLVNDWNRHFPAGTQVHFDGGRTRFTMGYACLVRRKAVVRLAGIEGVVPLNQVKPVDSWIQQDEDL